MRITLASIALLIVITTPSHAESLTIQENYPGAAGTPNNEAGGYVGSSLGGGYTRLTPVTGAGQIVDNDRPSITIHRGGSASSSLPPLPSSDPDGSRAREWLLNQ
jgi:hypothetical protein